VAAAQSWRCCACTRSAARERMLERTAGIAGWLSWRSAFVAARCQAIVP
jgi:hypothetical protein